MDIRFPTLHAFAGVALAAAMFHAPAQAQIGAPSPLKIEVLAPLENGVAIYQRMAPSRINGPEQARVHLQMRITNQTAKPVRLTDIKIFGTTVSNFVAPGSLAWMTDPAGQDDPIVQPLLMPGASMTWQNCNCDGAKALALDLPIAASAPIEITMKNGAKASTSVPLQAYAAKDLRWPGIDADLRVNEGWNVTSNHISWGQTFALDNQVAGWNGKSFSTLWPEAVSSDKRKEDHRAYGMPVYASADGIVCGVIRDHTEKQGVDSKEFTWSPSLGRKDGAGNSLKIRFGDYYMGYAHMQRWSIPEELTVGTRIHKGQYLGKVGNSGATSGPHLHFHMVKLDDPSEPPDSCEGGRILPMGFDQVQTITRAEANPLGVDGTLAAEHWNHVDNVAPPHAGSVLSPTPADFNFCADCSDAQTYLGVWNPGTDIDLRVKIAGWSAFTEHHARLSADGFRLRKIETFVENGERQYVGVFKRGSGPYALWQGEGWDNFVSVWNDQYSKGAYLTDIESFEIAGRRFYLGVFASGSGVPALIRTNGWSDFVAQRDALSADGKRLIDVETFMDGSTRVHLGVFEQGSGGHALRQLNGYDAFAADWSAQLKAGLRLVSVESFVSGSDRWYIGIYRAGTGSQGLSQNTSWANHWRKAEDLNYRNYRVTDLHVLQ